MAGRVPGMCGAARCTCGNVSGPGGTCPCTRGTRRGVAGSVVGMRGKRRRLGGRAACTRGPTIGNSGTRRGAAGSSPCIRAQSTTINAEPQSTQSRGIHQGRSGRLEDGGMSTRHRVDLCELCVLCVECRRGQLRCACWRVLGPLTSGTSSPSAVARSIW